MSFLISCEMRLSVVGQEECSWRACWLKRFPADNIIRHLKVCGCLEAIKARIHRLLHLPLLPLSILEHAFIMSWLTTRICCCQEKSWLWRLEDAFILSPRRHDVSWKQVSWEKKFCSILARFLILVGDFSLAKRFLGLLALERSLNETPLELKGICTKTEAARNRNDYVQIAINNFHRTPKKKKKTITKKIK